LRKNIASCLRQIITIQEPIVSDDEQWKDLKQVRAEVQALYDNSSGEVFSAMQLMDNSFYRFRIRYMQELKSNMRIVYNNRNFNIKRITNQGELNVITVIIAQEII
jgi:SPP1 family predicted phage head-tail adaptor